MAIPQGRLSTEPVEAPFGVPDNRVFYARTSYERGPIAIEDVSEGLQYQNWQMYWSPETEKIFLVGEDTSSITEIDTIPELVSLTFTFDQNGRVSYTYTTPTSSYLVWYDTALAQTVTTDLGPGAITPTIFMDDKRETQNQANDMMLWYTRANGDTFDLIKCLQRERFLIEHIERTGLTTQYIHNCGMNSELRVQFILKNKVPRTPYV